MAPTKKSYQWFNPFDQVESVNDSSNEDGFEQDAPIVDWPETGRFRAIFVGPGGKVRTNDIDENGEPKMMSTWVFQDLESDKRVAFTGRDQSDRKLQQLLDDHGRNAVVVDAIRIGLKKHGSKKSVNDFLIRSMPLDEYKGPTSYAEFSKK